MFLKTLQQSCFPTVKITKCKYKGCLFHVGSTKTKSGCFYKVWPSHWLEMNKNFKTTIKRQTLNHFKYFSLFFFFISVSLYSFFFFQFGFNIKCTSSYMHHETCCKICHNKHQSKWQTLVSWLHIQISPRLNKYPLILSEYSSTVHYLYEIVQHCSKQLN